MQNVVTRGKTATGVEQPILVEADGTVNIQGAVTTNPVQSKIIDNATFSQTVTGADINITDVSVFGVTYKTGTATTSPTMLIKLQVKDANGNYIDHPDYAQGTAVSTATSGIAFEGYLVPYATVRIVCTFGGSGNFATTTVEFSAK